MNEAPIDCGYDKLKMFFGENYVINEVITIYQVSVQEIVDFGQKYFFQAISPFVGNPTTYRLQLWDLGVDWNEIEDFDLFCMLITNIPPEVSCILFGRYDFTNLQLMMRKDTQERVLYDPTTDTIVDRATYIMMREYIRLAMNQYPKLEKARGKYTKMAIIDEDRMNIRNHERMVRMGKEKDSSSYLFNLISTMLITPGFKYKKNELRQINIVQFMEAVSRFQVWKSTESLMQGMYSGFLDTSKMNLDNELNWFREI